MHYILFILMFLGSYANSGHQCRWPLCPYKGVAIANSSMAVADYVGDNCTDAYTIDMLHMQYPALDADQLGSLLTSKH